MCENPGKFATLSYEQVCHTWTILIRPAGVPMNTACNMGGSVPGAMMKLAQVGLPLSATTMFRRCLDKEGTFSIRKREILFFHEIFVGEKRIYSSGK